MMFKPSNKSTADPGDNFEGTINGVPVCMNWLYNCWYWQINCSKGTGCLQNVSNYSKVHCRAFNQNYKHILQLKKDGQASQLSQYKHTCC